MADNESEGNGFWIFILFLIMFLGPCTEVKRNQNELDRHEEDIRQLEKEVQELKSERLE